VLLPDDLRPFAAERFAAAELDWTIGAPAQLLPAPVSVEVLDAAGRRALASWFSAGRTAEAARGRQRRRPSATDGDAVQLTLWQDPQD
jgi:hypothetical protein